MIACWALMANAAAQAPESSAPSLSPENPGVIRDMRDWASQAFTGVHAEDGAPRIDLTVVRQDYNVLRFGQSCMDTPLLIGTQRFAQGLGTHANSEIVVKIPAGANLFRAQVGVDNNDDTQGKHGTVEFVVEVDGQEAFRSPVMRGGQEPAPVSVNLPAGAATLTLKADTTPDGPSHDQCDWADACFVMPGDQVRWLDENQNRLLLTAAAPPFSFVYQGVPSIEAMKGWTRSVETVKEDAARLVLRVDWTDPATGLKVFGTVTCFKAFPACEWLVELENTGPQDTPLLEEIQAMDVTLQTGMFRHPAIVHELQGDACGESTFQPLRTALEAGKQLRRTPTGGRSSSISGFPFFNVEYEGQGLITAIGWTGQWALQLDRATTGPTRVRAGLEKTHLVLHPGERIRTPRILTFAWEGDRVAAHNAFRRLLLTQYVPQAEGQPVRLPVALQTFDRYNSRPGWATEAGQIAAVDIAHALGCDTYWLDAAWFPGNFPNGVGNWFCKPAEFPNGLKPVSDHCHQYGMKFVLWFEPERVAPGTQIATEHPEFVFGGKDGGLFKLNEPEARRWLTELLSQRISEYGIDIYRNDFNMDPLDYWRKNDPPDREGMSEIRYVEGLYGMWDELLARHPGLVIDNCSSGGRRIDLEMCSRSVPLWRSDTNCFSGHSEWKQAQSMTLGQYVPLHTACAWVPNRYDVRSATTGGLLCQLDYLSEGFSVEEAKGLVAEAKANNGFWYGDFYPLTPATTALDQVAAYQFHRPDLNAGLVAAFRRVECNYLGLILGLQAVQPDTEYAVEFIDDAGHVTTRTMRGCELAEGIELRLPEKESSLVVRYAPAKKR
jgi:alpha-galactosidase